MPSNLKRGAWLWLKRKTKSYTRKYWIRSIVLHIDLLSNLPKTPKILCIRSIWILIIIPSHQLDSTFQHIWTNNREFPLNQHINSSKALSSIWPQYSGKYFLDRLPNTNISIISFAERALFLKYRAIYYFITSWCPICTPKDNPSINTCSSTVKTI
jgi:hypothetical protein